MTLQSGRKPSSIRSFTMVMSSAWRRSFRVRLYFSWSIRTLMAFFTYGTAFHALARAACPMGFLVRFALATKRTLPFLTLGYWKAGFLLQHAFVILSLCTGMHNDIEPLIRSSGHFIARFAHVSERCIEASQAPQLNFTLPALRARMLPMVIIRSSRQLQN